MIDADALLNDCKALVRTLIDDLRALVAGGAPETCAVVEDEYKVAHDAGRTALAFADWSEGLYAQVAVAWVLCGVFVRFCEDNDLVADPLLAGPGNRRAIALDHRTAYLQANPAHDDRHWLREIFRRYRGLPATGEVFGDHNAVWLLAPSADGARAIVQFFQAVDPDTAELRHDYGDTNWSTRFLGDLYQDLSEHAKKTYALLQTPEFVEEFILDRTLEPALATFGLRETTLIDPTCGSGHFLLGAFHRLFDRWRETDPATNPREHARRALDAIGGVDLNPFAITIARFRLLVAALRAGGDVRLADAPAYPLHIAVGDSLLHGDPPGRLAGTTVHDEHAAAAAHGYATEDVVDARAILNRRWHAVVGNPPYITVKDPALSALYRARFRTCYRQYSLGVPFIERFFQLARSDSTPERAGYVGMINTNSFMKGEFGKKLIAEWVPHHDLTHVIDTSGVSVPHHGTPTIILLGRNRTPVTRTVRVVEGIRRNVEDRLDPAKGVVWTSIVAFVDEPGKSNDYISVVDLDRNRLSKHPWTLTGGGAGDLKEWLDRSDGPTLERFIDHIGYTGQTNADDAMTLADRRIALRYGLEDELLRELVVGGALRDWRVQYVETAFVPYKNDQLIDLRMYPEWLHRLWPYRETLLNRATFGKRTYRQEGRPWYEWHLIRLQRLRNPLALCFANVATHTHFVLDRHARLLNPHAPAVKLPAAASEDDHLALLAILNSSTACFWIKQVMKDKGSGGVSEGVKAEAWERFYEYDGGKLRLLPLPVSRPSASGRVLDSLASSLEMTIPGADARERVPTATRLAELENRYIDLRTRMIAEQERLDWETYRLYGLVEEDLTLDAAPEPPLQLGERAFEIVLARRLAAGEEEAASWFARHRSTPITELPSRWPDAYKRLVSRRIELIENDLNIGLVERPEYKRRWAEQPWDERVKAAWRLWLLDRLEGARYWPEPAALTTAARLAAQARTDTVFVEVARLYADRDDVDIAAVVADLVKDESVPYLAAYRYTESGMRAYAQWLNTWELQRREDAGEDVGTIPVPPKYAKKDFQAGAWEHRGKLDVARERFISYPGAQRETDASLVIGWAGWNHLARARALAAWYVQATRDGRDHEHLTPLLAGLAELVPWLLQWYDDPSSDPALDRRGSQIAALVDSELRTHRLTAEDLTAWRPVQVTRGRARR